MPVSVSARLLLAAAITLLAARYLCSPALAAPPLPAPATHPEVVLLYRVDARAAGCPDEAQLKSAVSARLGYDPFRAQAPRTVEVRIERDRRAAEGRGLRAHVGLVGAGGRAAGSRDLVSRSGDCGELASSLTLAISIAIDPLALTAPPVEQPSQQSLRCPPLITCPPAPPPQECPPPPPAPACPPPTAAPPSTPPPSERRPIGLRLGAGGLLAIGASPSVASGGAWVRAGLRVGSFSLDAEGRADPGIETQVAGSRGLSTTLLLGELVPCFHARWFAGCAVVGAGVMRGSGVGVANPARDQSVFVIAGGRAGVEIPLWRALQLDVHADLLAHLTPVAFRLDGEVVWTTPALSGALGVGVLGAFP